LLRLVRNHARVSDLFLEMASRESDARMRSVIERANKETSTAIRCDLRAFQVTRSWCTVCFTPIFEIDMARVRCGAYKERVESSRFHCFSCLLETRTTVHPSHEDISSKAQVVSYNEVGAFACLLACQVHACIGSSFGSACSPYFRDDQEQNRRFHESMARTF